MNSTSQNINTHLHMPIIPEEESSHIFEGKEGSIFKLYGYDFLKQKLEFINRKTDEFRYLMVKYKNDEKMKIKIHDAMGSSIWFNCRNRNEDGNDELNKHLFSFLLICFSNIYIKKNNMNLNGKYSIEEFIEKSKMINEEDTLLLCDTLDDDTKEIYNKLYIIS